MAPRSAFRLFPLHDADQPTARWTLWAGLAAVLLCLLCAVFLDVPIVRWVDTFPPKVRSVAEVLSRFGLSGYMLTISGLMAAGCFGLAARMGLRRQRRRLLRHIGEQAFFVFSAVAVSGLIVQVIKHTAGRARPSLMDRFGPYHFDHFSIKASLASFPSGHATSIFALAVALTLLLPRVAALMFPLALAVGAARIILDAHYASDILAGAILGTITTLMLAAVFAKRSIAFTRTDGTSRIDGGFGLAVKPLIARETS